MPATTNAIGGGMPTLRDTADTAVVPITNASTSPTGPPPRQTGRQPDNQPHCRPPRPHGPTNRPAQRPTTALGLKTSPPRVRRFDGLPRPLAVHCTGTTYKGHEEHRPTPPGRPRTPSTPLCVDVDSIVQSLRVGDRCVHQGGGNDAGGVFGAGVSVHPCADSGTVVEQHELLGEAVEQGV